MNNHHGDSGNDGRTEFRILTNGTHLVGPPGALLSQSRVEGLGSCQVYVVIR